MPWFPVSAKARIGLFYRFFKRLGLAHEATPPPPHPDFPAVGFFPCLLSSPLCSLSKLETGLWIPKVSPASLASVCHLMLGPRIRRLSFFFLSPSK